MVESAPFPYSHGLDKCIPLLDHNTSIAYRGPTSYIRGMRKELTAVLGYEFKKPTLLVKALTHPSRKSKRVNHDYERLEFLGDRVLGLVIADMIYHRYPSESEGDLAKRLTGLVRREACTLVAEKIGLVKHMNVSAGDITPNSAVLCDAIEALIGALFLDGGIEPAKTFIQTHWSEILEQSIKPPKDAKTHLQEWSQQKGYGIPVYTLLSHSGPDHAPSFEVEVTIAAHTAAGAGTTKRMAEQVAAQQLLERVQ